MGERAFFVQVWGWGLTVIWRQCSLPGTLVKAVGLHQVSVGKGAGVGGHPPQQAQAQHLLQGEAHHLSPGCELGARLPARGVGRGCSCPSISGASFSLLQPKKGGGISFNSTVTLTQCSEKLVQLILHEYSILTRRAGGGGGGR